MSEHHDDENSNAEGRPLTMLENRELLVIGTNLMADSIEHRNALEALCDSIRTTDKVAGKVWIHKLAEEIRRDGRQRMKRADEIDALIGPIDAEATE